MQHHDAITGTEKEHVARDYSRILEAGIQDCLKVSEKAIKYYTFVFTNFILLYEYVPIIFLKLDDVS